MSAAEAALRRSSSANGTGATASPSSRAWARPRSCTSICRIRRAADARGERHCACRATSSRLTDPEGRPVAKGEPGILWVRGDSQAPCYWNRSDKTAETMRGGWIYTGDRFRRERRRILFLRRPRGRSGEGERAMGPSAGGGALPRRASRRPGVRVHCHRRGEPADDPSRVRRLAARTPWRRGDDERAAAIS